MVMEYKLQAVEDLTKEDLLKVVEFYEEKNKEVEHHLKFAFSISDFEIKLSILKSIKEYMEKGEETVVKALQDLILDIYMYPEDIFEVTPIDDLIIDVEEQEKEYRENIVRVRFKEEVMTVKGGE